MILNSIRPLYDVVRLVDIRTHRYYQLNKEGTDLVEAPQRCFDIWGRPVCENCISAKVVNKRVTASKFERLGDQVFFIVAEYMEVDGAPYSLELAKSVEKDTIFTGFGKNYILNTLEDYNNKVYRDPLTHAYNRLYLEDHYASELEHTAVALVDLDYLKFFNDLFGHGVGDLAISTVSDIVQHCIKDTDAVIRFGGDEFVVIFEGISYHAFEKRLKEISETVKATKLEGYPDLKLSVSIGGYYGCGAKEDLIKHADMLLYKAKQQRGSVCVEDEHCCHCDEH